MEIHFYTFYKYIIFFGCVCVICYLVNAKTPTNYTFIINFSLIITILFMLFDIVTKFVSNAKLSDTINISIDKYANLDEQIDHMDDHINAHDSNHNNEQKNMQTNKIVDDLITINMEKEKY